MARRGWAVANVDQPISVSQWIVPETGRPNRYFYQFMLDLWKRTGASADSIEVSTDTDFVPDIGAQVLKGEVEALQHDFAINLLGRIDALERKIIDLEAMQ